MASVLVQSLTRLYASGRLTAEQIAERVTNGSITEADYKTITGEEYDDGDA